MPAFEIVAGHAGVCPLCCRGIAKSRSRIAPIAATPLNPEHCRWYAERGKWLVRQDYMTQRLHGRTWAHAACVDDLDAKYTPDEQAVLAAEWRGELVAKKRSAEALLDHHCGRRRASKVVPS